MDKVYYCEDGGTSFFSMTTFIFGQVGDYCNVCRKLKSDHFLVETPRKRPDPTHAFFYPQIIKTGETKTVARILEENRRALSDEETYSWLRQVGTLTTTCQLIYDWSLEEDYKAVVMRFGMKARGYMLFSKDCVVEVIVIDRREDYAQCVARMLKSVRNAIFLGQSLLVRVPARLFPHMRDESLGFVCESLGFRKCDEGWRMPSRN